MWQQSPAAVRYLRWIALSLFFAIGPWLAVSGAVARGAGQDKSNVKVSAVGGKIDNSGKQILTITMQIEPGWHAYANPVKHEEFEAAQTIVMVAAAKKLDRVTIEYPAGRPYKDGKDVFQVYEGKVEIKAMLQRAAGDTGPLEVTVKYMVCNDRECLPPETVKLQVK